MNNENEKLSKNRKKELNEKIKWMIKRKIIQ